jgi:hypothetical protein
MPVPVQGISITDLLRKAEDPVEDPRIAVLRGVPAFEDEACNWLTDQLLKRLRATQPEAQIADIGLSNLRILSGVSNDPDDTAFSPQDQFPIVLDALQHADLVLVATHTRLGLPNADVVRVLERLDALAAKRPEAEHLQSLVDRTALCVLATGEQDALPAGEQLASAFLRLGFTPLRRGVVTWNAYQGDVFKSRECAAVLDELSRAATQFLQNRK